MVHLCLVFVMLWVLQFLEKLTQELIHAGPEIGVASTKAFTTQITVLTMIALRLAKAKGTIA
jgi:glucosamine 6-phosphate synthetase-like amidotransferase/phosphosugar isomerase protein